jgi:hypothetical protein
MSNYNPFYSPIRLQPAPWPSKPGQLLFEFVRAADRAPMSCVLRFHGESYGWEVQFFERSETCGGRLAFSTRTSAIRWAEAERDALERP